MKIITFSEINNYNLTDNDIKDFIIDIACHEFDLGYEKEFRNADYNKMKNIFIMIDENNNIIGTIMIDNNNFLKGLYVDRNYRRKGIAKMLLNKLINYSKDNNILEIRLGTNFKLKEAISFYLKNNFKRIENKYTNDKDDVFFSLRIEDYD